jgi:formylglycine-generating enzyme required for sulfatase activity
MPRYALLLAADLYRDPQISPLRYAERDARVQEGFLREVAGFDRVEELYGERLEKAAALDLAEEMADQLQSEGGGVLLVFYAGHGFTHLGKHCLLCPKARLRYLDEYEHAVTVDRLRRATDRPRVERQLVIDACRTVLRVGDRHGTAGYQAAGLRDLAGLPGLPEEAGGFSVLASCDEGEQANEVAALKHGVFAMVWMEELRRAQREGRELRVDDALVKRLRERVATLAREHGLDRLQRPWWRGNADPVVLIPGSAGPAGKAPERLVEPPVTPPSPSRLEQLQAEAKRRADAVRTEAERKTAEEARRRAAPKAAYERLYPVYLALLSDPHVSTEELAEAWAEVCRECSIEAPPAVPGELESVGLEIRVMPRRIRASRERPWENSLGMRFVPVKTSADGKSQVLFSIWPTRVQDYAEYAKAKPGVDGSWKDPVWEGVKVTPEPTCPVVSVSWEDAKGFCAWLTQRDRAAGLIPASAEYRLPTDVEWSWAVGIGEAEEKAGAGRTPQEKSMKIAAGSHPYVYPWGKEWPPKKGAGNYADATAKKAFPKFGIIDGYDDGFATTSPVGSFPANPNGLYDLGGNTWEWCEDFSDGKSGSRVLRGSSWCDFGSGYLLSSYRSSRVAGFRDDYYGFRLVLVGVLVC